MYHKIHLTTHRNTEFINITGTIERLLTSTRSVSGICYIFVPHTTAAITINENADPDVASDIERFLTSDIDKQCDYLHGEGNSPAHIKASLLGSSQTIIFEDGRLLLGTWQGIYFCEFDGPRQRTYFVKLICEG